jgi:hypothetical protein
MLRRRLDVAVLCRPQQQVRLSFDGAFRRSLTALVEAVLCPGVITLNRWSPVTGPQPPRMLLHGHAQVPVRSRRRAPPCHQRHGCITRGASPLRIVSSDARGLASTRLRSQAESEDAERRLASLIRAAEDENITNQLEVSACICCCVRLRRASRVTRRGRIHLFWATRSRRPCR